MIFDHTEVYNFEGAFRGLRNPMNSWDKSDSWFGIIDPYTDDGSEMEVVDHWIAEENKERKEQNQPELRYDMYDDGEYYDALENYSKWFLNTGILSSPSKAYPFFSVAFLGPKDLHLAQKLILAGNEHAKFMRQIGVCVDITAPLYWWKEFDTYKIGTVANSTSTMHKLAAEPITKEMFEFDETNDLYIDMFQTAVIDGCEELRQMFVNTGNTMYWRALVQILPSAYLQKRTLTLSYANLRNIYFQRQNHKLIEWNQFCKWIETLPYACELITIGGNK